uniref:SAM-dependent MTase TRM10-type domain-containing protein n=1 Tax=Acrobeloides nanus TaxID=290746 RepID=A0A914E8N0_9BILA
MSKFRPSTTFMKWIRLSPYSHILERRLERLLKEVEVFEYFSNKVPSKIEDKFWLRLMSTDNLRYRVTLLNSIGENQFLSRSKTIDKDINETLVTGKLIREMERMKAVSQINEIYRTHTFELKDPETQKIIGAKNCQAIRLNDLPHIYLDFQSFDTMNPAWKSRLAIQAGLSIYENCIAPLTLPLSLVSFNPRIINTKSFIEKYCPMYLNHKKDSMVLPDIYQDFPRDLIENPDEVAYITNSGGQMLDGPLTKKAYIIPMYLESQMQSNGNARRMGINTYSFPLLKYIKWRSGSKSLSRPTMVNILRDVIHSGGDWYWALHKNIPIHSMRSRELTFMIAGKKVTTMGKIKDNTEEVTNFIRQALNDEDAEHEEYDSRLYLEKDYKNSNPAKLKSRIL